MSSVEAPVPPESEGRPWTLADLAGPPTCLAVLPGGSIVTGSTCGPILVRSSGGGLIGRLDGHDGAVTTLVALSARQVASAGTDGTVRFWDLPDATSTLATRHEGAATALALNRHELASAGADGTIRTWPLRDGAPRVVAESRVPMTALTATGDGWFVGGDADGQLWVCDPEEGAEEPVESGHAEGGIQALVAVGRVLASAARSRVRLWDLGSDGPAEVLEGHEGQVQALLAQENGMLVSAANDGSVRQWDLEGRAHRIGPTTGTELASPPSPVRALATLASGSLAALGEDGVVYSWFGRIVTPSLAHPSPPVEALVATSDGLVASASPTSVSFWDPDTGVRLRQAPLSATDHLDRPRLLAPAPEGRVVSAAGTAVQVWGPRDGIPVSTWELPDPVIALAVAGDGRVLAADDTAMVHTRFLREDGGLADAASFSVGRPTRALAAWPRLAAAVDAGSTIRAIDLGDDFRPLPTLGGGGDLRAATGAGDERLAVAQGADGVTIYDVRKGEERSLPSTGGGEVTAMAEGWHHDLAVATSDGRVRVWPAANDALVTDIDPWVVEAHAQAVSTVAVLPDGEWVATGSHDGTIRLWAVLTGAEVTPPGDTSSGRSMLLPGLTVAAMAGDGAAEEDRLGFADHTEALARVLASKKTSPPMAVALLGDWGSGKSSFMLQLEHELDRVAESRRDSPDNPFCRRLLHVHFNVWQYADTHLWSGLATGLFEQLHRAVPSRAAGDGEDEAQLRRELVVEERHLDEVDQEIDEVELASERLERVPTALRDHAAVRRLAGIAADQELRTVPGLREAAAALRRRRLVAMGAALVALVALVAVLANETVARWVAVVPGLASTALVTAGSVLHRWGRQITKAHDRLASVLSGKDPGPTEERLVSLYKRRNAILHRRDALLDLLGESEPEVRLARFLADKAESADYVPYRGLLDFVRRDLDALRDHLDDDCRVVIYVDDLDRCDPQRVVEVLAAVHLMVAYPHVIVIVAVDARWLLTCLRLHYRELLALDESAGLGGFDASPSEYLEKIFQFAYAVPRPSSDLVPYLADLLPVEPASTRPPSGPAMSSETLPSAAATTPSSDDVADAGPEAELGARRPTPEVDGGADRPGAEAASRGTGSRTSGEGPPVDAAGRTGRDDPRASGSPAGRDAPPPVDDVVVRAEERDYVAALAPLLGTPRTVKRLANVYRVLRARIPTAELDGYLQRSEYGAVLLLLAVVLGRPLAAPAVFERLQGAAARESDVRAALSPAASTPSTPDREARGSTPPAVAPDSLPIADVERTLADLVAVELVCTDPLVYERWLPEVAAYSFRYRELLDAIDRAG